MDGTLVAQNLKSHSHKHTHTHTHTVTSPALKRINQKCICGLQNRDFNKNDPNMRTFFPTHVTSVVCLICAGKKQ